MIILKTTDTRWQFLETACNPDPNQHQIVAIYINNIVLVNVTKKNKFTIKEVHHQLFPKVIREIVDHWTNEMQKLSISSMPLNRRTAKMLAGVQLSLHVHHQIKKNIKRFVIIRDRKCVSHSSCTTSLVPIYFLIFSKVCTLLWTKKTNSRSKDIIKIIIPHYLKNNYCSFFHWQHKCFSKLFKMFLKNLNQCWLFRASENNYKKRIK